MDANKEAPRSYSLIETIGALIGLSSLLGMFSWFLGRIYYGSFYGIYGIKLELVDVPNNDVIMRGALYLFPVLLKLLILVIFFWVIKWIDNEWDGLINSISDQIFTRVDLAKKKRALNIFAVIVIALILYWTAIHGVWSQFMFVSVFTALLIFLLFFEEVVSRRVFAMIPANSSYWSFAGYYRFYLLFSFVLIFYCGAVFETVREGYKQGCMTIYTYAFTVYSNQPLPLAGGKPMEGHAGLIEYSNYYGFVGKDFIVLYNKVDKKTRQPTKYFYLQKDGNYSISVVYQDSSISPSKPIENQCTALAKKKFYLR